MDYPLYGTFAPERIVRITQLLQSKEKFSVQDMQNFQMDRTDAYAMHWKDRLAGWLRQEGYDAQAGQLARWDGRADAASGETALIALFFHYLRKEIFEDETGKDLRWVRMGLVLQILEDENAPWYDNIRTKDKRETRQDMIKTAIQKAMRKWQGKPWGDFQSLTMRHPMSVVPLLSDMLGLQNGPFPWGGTPGTLNASFYFPDEKEEGHFKSIVGPSWRFVIDFSDIDAATMVLPAGNSGNPASEHFMDFFELWRSGKRWNVPFHYEKVKEKSVRTIVLEKQG